jgi:hypothetical protein
MKKETNEQKIIHSVMSILASGETRITRYGVMKHSGVERSQVYSILKK